MKCEANRRVIGLLDSVYFDEFDTTTLKYLNFELILPSRPKNIEKDIITKKGRKK
jgi:hypothetical protein